MIFWLPRWADTTETTGNPVYGLSPIFDNGGFILRAVDFLSGKTELLGLNNKENSNFQTVGQAVYNNVFNRHANEYNKLQQELNTRLSALQNQEKNNKRFPNDSVNRTHRKDGRKQKQNQ